MRKNIVLSLVFCMLFSLIISNLAYAEESYQSEFDKVNIGIIYEGNDKFNLKLKKRIEKEVLELLSDKYQVEFSEFRADDLAVHNIVMDKLLANQEIDVIITAGILGSYSAISRDNFSKAVIAPFIIDDDTVNFSIKEDKSGVENLNFITVNSFLKRDIKFFKRLTNFDKMTFITPKNLIMGNEKIVELLNQEAKENNIKVDYIYTNNSKKDIIKELDKVEVAYIFPLISEDKGSLLLAELNQRKIPTFTLADIMRYKEGFLAGYSHNKEINARARAAALNLELILAGEEAADLPIYIDKSDEEFVINMKVAHEIGFLPDWDILETAKLINQDNSVKEELTLQESIETALDNNLDLQAAEKDLDIAQDNLKQASNKRKPKFDLNTTYAQVDETRAGKGIASEQKLTGGLKLEQVLFSEDLNANIDIKGDLYKQSKVELKKKKLDLILDTINSYIQTLKVRADMRLQEENIQLIKDNLNIAKTKNEIGVSGPADIYRWESQQSVGLMNLSQAESQLRMVKDNLKRTLNLPLTEDIELTEIDQQNLFQELYKEFKIDNSWELENLSEKLVKESIQNSPEVESIDYLIKVKEREYQMKKRRYYLPQIGLSAQYDTYLEEWGIDGPSGADAHGEDEWSIGIQASFPLYDGGNKKVELSKVKKEIQQLKTTKKSLVDKLSQNLRNKLTVVNTEYRKNKYAKDAVDTAYKNLELVKDAYSKGLVSVAELLDAQSAVINAKRQEFVTKYNFLNSVAEVQRALGNFDIIDIN
ncbi:TolC family protein [Orenia marismortui]|uniref:TolC family protein n=1 Tax=Orenia marismortui TaxID=46469 RepID=UPI00036A9F59|nr:TolC family protein [Orenia marismortui]